MKKSYTLRLTLGISGIILSMLLQGCNNISNSYPTQATRVQLVKEKNLDQQEESSNKLIKEEDKENRNDRKTYTYQETIGTPKEQPTSYQLARMYEDGITEGAFKLEKDLVKEFELYKKAAKLGCIEAQVKLGDLYIQEGPNRRYEKAIKWYLRSADQGDAIAQYKVAKIFQSEWRRRNIDATQIFKWYKSAAQQDHVEAQYELGNLYKDKQKYGKAMQWHEKAATMGNANAQFELGVMYQEGLGLPQPDFEKATEYYKRAATQGHAEALKNLIRIYLNFQYKDEQSGFSSELRRLMHISQEH